MGRLIGGVTVLVGWSCFATVCALMIVVSYAWSKGFFEPAKLETMAAIAHGVEMLPKADAERMATKKGNSERPSLESVELHRAALTTDMELRENMIDDREAEFKKLQRSLVEEKDRFGQVVSAFQARLEGEKAEAIKEGRRQFQSIVESMKPRQAKEQLLLKYKENKIDVVVETLKNMDEAKRAKVLTEFKAAEDQEILAKILENIRSPGVAEINDTLDKLKAPTQGQ